MTNIRRYSVPNAAVFITAVCYQRRPVLNHDREKERLLAVMREVKTGLPYRMLAYVILDDHFHWLIRPGEGMDCSRIMQSVKLRFARRYKRRQGIRGRFVLWQRRFWDHVIRDQRDFHRHLDYIHYNPVKHGVVAAPVQYRWSSFQAYVERERYTPSWGMGEEPAGVTELELE